MTDEQFQLQRKIQHEEQALAEAVRQINRTQQRMQGAQGRSVRFMLEQKLSDHVTEKSEHSTKLHMLRKELAAIMPSTPVQ